MSSSTPSSSPPIAAPVATPGAPLVLQPVSPSTVTPGGTPFSPSLFTQLQAAQASSGASAVGAILMARSKELMGFTNAINEASPDSPLIDEETKARFMAESNELQGFAELLQSSPEGMAVASMWTTLAQKYNDEGSGLQNEALNLWTQLNSSNEAQELTETSADILRQWREFAMSTEGAKLITQSQNMLKDQSSVLGGMLQSIGTYFSTQPAPSPAPSGASSTAAVVDSASPSPAASSVSVPSTSASPAVGALADAGLTLHKEKLMKTTHKVSTALAGDEDVKLLLARSSNLIKSYSASPAIDSTKSSTPGISSSPAIESDKKENSRTSAASPLSAVTDPNAVADATGVALKAGETYLKSLRESEVGNVLLAKGLVLLQQNKDMLKPENFTSMSSTLASDAEARQQFLTKMKDVALDFLLSYLPTVVVPPIIGEKDRVAYEISNIDLGGFHVDSNNVVVTIDENNSIEVRATKISCEMKNLIWNYKKLTFPKFSGKGTADANAKQVEFVLKLKLEYPKPGSEKKENEADSVDAVDEPTDSDSEAPDMVRVKSKSKSELEAKSKSPSQSPEPVKRPKSASIAHLAKRAKEKAIAAVAPAAAASSSSPPVASSPSPSPSPEATTTAAFLAVAPAAADVPAPVGAPVAAPPAGPVPSFGEKLLETVKIDLGRPKLVMDSCFMKLHDFDIHIHTGYFKTVYNFLLGLFKDSVKLYLENTLNNAIVVRSVYLLDTINVLAVDYLPLLQRIMIKATTAAIAEDTPIDETIANAAQGLASAVTAAAAPSTSSASSSSSAAELPVAPKAVLPVAPVLTETPKSDPAPAAASSNQQLSSQSLADFYKI